MLTSEKIILLLVLMIICGVTDIWNRKIYNFITFPFIIMGLLVNFYLNGYSGLLSSAGALGICFVLFIILYITGGFGAGDVKLMMALGAIVGMKNIFTVIVYCVLAGGVMANIILIINKQFIQSWKHALRFFLFLVPFMKLKSEPLKKRDSIKVPFGYAISMGTLIYVFLH